MIRVFKSPTDFIKFRESEPWHTRRIGFVPTMGALHEGHGQLFETASHENDLVVASIFVNPTQFNDPEDLKKYPRNLDSDLKILESKGVDYLLYPDFESMYPDQYRYKLTESELSKRFCGAHRPGHFDGVLTVVMKLFNIVAPTHAYFGEKDFQQLSLIRDMVKCFFMPITIVPCPTVRERDGLAMSSRNLLLSDSERVIAPILSRALTESPDPESVRKQLEQAGFRVDYVEDFENRRLAAAFLGKVRLIDNVTR